MSLIYEYGDRREAKGKKEGKKEYLREMLLCWINSGNSLIEFSQKTGKSIGELEDILAAD